jgi:type VI secretion system secreted protein Hcp
MASYVMVMKVAGVTGDVTEPSHTGWIRIHGLQWRGRRALTMRTGSSADREPDNPAISELEIKKELDIASGGLLGQFLGKTAGTVQIDFCRTGDKRVDVYLSITLTNSLFSLYEMVSTGDRPSEGLRMNYTKIEVKATEMGPDGSPGQPFTSTYDLSTVQVT